MNRKTFLTIGSGIAFTVGAFALLAPSALLASKGVVSEPAVVCWVRQVGVALIGIGATAFMIRDHAPSPTVRAALLGNGLHQTLLAPIEVVAYLQGTITKLSGIVPNTLLHVALAVAFFRYAFAEPRTASDVRGRER